MILPITKYGHPVLRKKGVRITQITDEVCHLADDMLETMDAAHGVGLAAQQIGRAIMMTVIDVSPSEQPSTMEIGGAAVDLDEHMPLVLLNPIVKNHHGQQVGPEGCLSIPEVNAEIPRANAIEVEAVTLDGEKLSFRCTGLLSRCVQHEVDHLNGILFIDRMDAATRAAFSGQLKKLQKETQAALATKKPKKLTA